MSISERVSRRREIARIHLRNHKTQMREQGVGRIFVNGVRVAAVNAVAAQTTYMINYYLEQKGLNSRRVSLTVVPNPDRPNERNPRRNIL